MEETISLKELFQTIRKRLWLIVLITVIITTTSGLVSYFLLTPIYESQAQILVNQEKSAEQAAYSTGDIQANVQLINTYNIIIKSPAVLDLVSQELDGKVSTSQLNSMISVASAQNSQVLNITVQNEDPVLAAAIANKTAEVFQEQVVELMSVDNVKILWPAQVGENPSPVKPQPVLNMAIAMVVGLMASVGLAFLLEFLDNTVKTEQDIEKLLNLPVLGTVAFMEDKDIQEAQRMARKVARTRGETIGS